MPAARRVWTCPFPPSMELRVDGLTKSPQMHTADGRMDRSNEVADAASVVALGPSVERNVRSFGRFDRLYTSFMETRRRTMSPTSAAVDAPELAAAPAADARDRRNAICSYEVTGWSGGGSVSASCSHSPSSLRFWPWLLLRHCIETLYYS